MVYRKNNKKNTIALNTDVFLKPLSTQNSSKRIIHCVVKENKVTKELAGYKDAFFVTEIAHLNQYTCYYFSIPWLQKS